MSISTRRGAIVTGTAAVLILTACGSDGEDDPVVRDPEVIDQSSPTSADEEQSETEGQGTDGDEDHGHDEMEIGGDPEALPSQDEQDEIVAFVEDYIDAYYTIEVGQTTDGFDEKVEGMTAEDFSARWEDENDEILSSNHHQVVETRVGDYWEFYEFDEDTHQVNIQLRTGAAAEESDISDDDFTDWETKLFTVIRNADGWLIAEHDVSW